MAAVEWVRKHSTTIIISLLIGFLLIVLGCAEISSELRGTAKPEGGITESVPISKTYAASHDKIWQATRNVLDEWGYIYEANPSSNTIKTEPKYLNDPQKFRIVGSDYTAKLHITVEGSTVSLRARFSKKSNIVGGGENLEYPEKENEIRKNFFEALDNKLRV